MSSAIYIPAPMEYNEVDFAKRELFTMECNVRRMRFMIENGYFCKEYSEDEWQKFKKIKWNI